AGGGGGADERRAPAREAVERRRHEALGAALEHEHGGSAERAAAESLERLVRLFELEGLDLRAHGDRGRKREELVPVPAREVRDRAEDALPPEQLVRKRGDVAHVDSRADDS